MPTRRMFRHRTQKCIWRVLLVSRRNSVCLVSMRFGTDLSHIVQAFAVGYISRWAAQVLLEFPIEVVSALVAGRWAASASAARPFMAGYKLRLGMAAIVTTLVRC